MTNAQYIMTLLTDRDLAELYTKCGSPWSYQSANNKRIRKAFDNWRRDTYRPNRNFIKEGEPEPSVWEWSRIHNKDNTGFIKGRESLLSFQHWLFLQFNEKHWG